MTEQPQEGSEPMTAQPTTTPEEAPPFPVDQTTGMPIPPAPTAEEEAERVARAKERNRRAEELADAAYAKRHQEAMDGAEEALARLIAFNREETAAREEAVAAGLPAPERRVFKEHDYLIVDTTEDRARAANKVWDADLEVVRNLHSEDDSLTTWKVSDIEDPRAKAAVEHFVGQLPYGKKRHLIVVGSVGAGKTAVAIATGHAAVARGIPTRYVSHAAYLSALRPEGVPPNGLRKDEYRKAMVKAQVLVLDDFCADMNTDAPASEFARRETIELLNSRMAQGKSTIVTTNVTTEQVRTIMDDRVASRLGTNAVVVQMVEKDRRKPTTW